MPGTTRDEHQAARLIAIRRRTCSNTHLKDRGIATPAAIGTAAGMSAAEAVRRLTQRQWREGDVAVLRAVADRLGLEVFLKGLDPSASKGRTS
jgi:uncharacterized caspase-like protein